MQTARSRCCNESMVVDSGFMTCVNCGSVTQRELDVGNIGFSSYGAPITSNVYTRSSRFSNKVLANLLGKTHHRCDDGLLLYLRQCRIKKKLQTPEQLLLRIADYTSPSMRKPYAFARQYWEQVTFQKVPPISQREEQFICKCFDECFFAWERLNLGRPKFPMTCVLRLIITQFNLSENAHYICRFARELRCPVRRLRYKKCFKKCIAYIKQNEQRCGFF